MHLIEMSDYTLAPEGSGRGIKGFYFALSVGDVCAIEAQNPDDAHQFLRALATLEYPLKGTFRFKGRRLNLKNYKELLGCKKKIGYIAPDAALISNLTVRQNILIHRYYFENDLTIDLDDKLNAMCDTFGVCQKLDRRPADLNSMERQMAIVIREISKGPEVLLLDRPEDFIGHAKFDILVQLFNDWIGQRKPVVFVSFDRRLIRRFATRKILITNGSLTTVDIKRSMGDE
jgi:ABC-type lipoprotein export system ATPase subunit